MRYLEKTFWCSLVIHCISLAFISGCGDASGVLVVSPEVTNLEWKPENDGHQTVDILLQNNGRGPLTIQKVTTTCSCTLVTSGKKTLSIGEKTKLSLDATVPQYGNQEVVVTIETDSKVTPSCLVRLRLSGRKEATPQIWSIPPVTWMKFHDLGGPIATEVEMVTLEDATASPWIVGLTPEPGSDSAGLECRLARVTEDTTSGSGVTVRTYKFSVSATPKTSDRDVLVLTVQTNGVPDKKIRNTTIIIEPTPHIRVLPNEIMLRRRTTGISEAIFVLASDDDSPFEVLDQSQADWYSVIPDDVQNDSSTLRRMKLQVDWARRTKEMADDDVLMLKVNHPACAEVYVPIHISG